MEFELPASCFVYGGGGFGKRVVASLEGSGREIAGVVDRRPGFVAPTDSRLSGATVVLGVCNPESDPKEIQAALAKVGVAHVISPVQLSRALHRAGLRLDNYWLTGSPDVYAESQPEIRRARALLQDSVSQQVFDGVLMYRKTGELQYIPSPEPAESIYAPRDLPFISAHMRFVDGGSYTGDTVKSMETWGFDEASVLCFEPDPDNYGKLISGGFAANIRPIYLPLALGSSLDTAWFSPGEGAASHAATEGTSKVLVTRLDDVARDWNPTHIKLDVEGSELRAIDGMAETLARHRPRLALSTYHCPEHHWEIINRIDDMKLEYDYFLRVYGYQTFDTVLYCIPRGNK